MARKMKIVPRKRMNRKVAVPMEVRLKRQMNIHHFRRLSSPITPYYGAGGSMYGVRSFFLGDVINVSDFTALFDSYRINKVVCNFQLRTDPGGQSPFFTPVLYTAIDRDDLAVPTSINEVREYSRCQTHYLDPKNPASVVLCPNIKLSEGVGINAAEKYKQWIDLAFTTTVHHGLKWCIPFMPTGYEMTLEVIYYFSCKDTK
jgi:hypothetical protein